MDYIALISIFSIAVFIVLIICVRKRYKIKPNEEPREVVVHVNLTRLNIPAPQPAIPTAPELPLISPPSPLPSTLQSPLPPLRVSRFQKCPEMFLCPITQEIMQDPVIASDGHTYEKEAIKKWTRCGRNVSPMTNLPFESAQLIPNHNLKSAIEAYKVKDLSNP
jgi:hypothetical protein